MPDYFDEGDRIRKWLRDLDKPERVLKVIGTLMVSESQDSFKKQAFGRKKWSARAPINVYGIIADLSVPRTPPARRFETRPALQDSGRLAMTIAYDFRNTKEIEVGSNLDYSGALNYGGAIESEPITETVQRRISRWLKKQTETIQGKLGWLTSPDQTGKTLKGRVEARPFVGLSDQTVEDIIEVVGSDLFGGE